MKKKTLSIAALVLIVITAFAFKTYRAPTVYYQYTGVQPPTAASVTTAANWTSIPTALIYVSGTKLYFIEFDAATTNLIDAETILANNVSTLVDNQSYSQTFGGILETVKVHLRR
ncbi:MAG: hypothetical protein J0H74_27565 [Chitinophagaceae bacterium]|nr:hypothetical protein [Chitinophagaceae bacterium]